MAYYPIMRGRKLNNLDLSRSPSLVSALFFDDIVDLATNNYSELVSTAELNADGLKTVGVWGEAAASADRLDITNAAINAAIDGDEWTAFFKFRLDALTSNYSMAGQGSPSTGVFTFGPILKTTGDLNFTCRNGGVWYDSVLAAGVSRSTAEFISIAIRYDGANLQAVIDGVAKGLVTYSASNFPSAGVLSLSLGSARRSSSNTNYYSEDATQEYFQFYNKALDVGEIIDRQESPYQILKKRRKLFVVPSGATDTTAPILSSPTGTKTGSTTASGTVSTDEANGTLYYLASENATETAATIKTGSSQTVTATGVQNVSFTGLTASTLYYAHYVHDDAASNESNVQTSASFTTDAASSVIAIFRRRIEGQGNAFR